MDEGLPQEKLCRGPLLHENFIFFHTFRRRWECNTICAVAGDGVMHLFHEREKIQKDEGWLCCSCRKTEFFDLFCLQKPSGFLIDFVRRNPAAFCLFCSQNPEGVLLDWFIKKGYLMRKIIFCGHGCYGEYFKMAFKMLLGETEDLYFVNFLPSEDSSQLLENLKKEMAAVSQNQNIPTVTPQSTQTAEQKPSETAVKSPVTEPKTDVNSEAQKSGGKLIVQSPVTVRKGSYCVNPNPAESAFDTDTVEDSYAEHGYMADISFQDCVINSGSSVKHTGPVTVTVSLAEEKNYDSVMNRDKWYLENGQLTRINGRDSMFLYFNGWLMYKKSN